MKDLNEILDHISDLQVKNRNKEFYNVFHSLGFRTQETMHSKFIASLLNPKDQHGMKHDFLNHFLKIINPEFKIKNVSVRTEKPANGRRIDITIENNDSIIIIENKIFAKDQYLQLEDYYGTCKVRYKTVDLIYLTPFGIMPSDITFDNTNSNAREIVKCISYEKVIIPWIDECAKESQGRLKTSLEMYSELLSVLINRDKYMNQLFDYLTEDKVKLKAAFDICSALQGRNYIKMYPESKSYLLNRINHVLGDMAEPYLEEEDTIISITDNPEYDVVGWRIHFDENEVYSRIFPEEENKIIQLFSPVDINDKKLKSLIFEDDVIVDEWLSELFGQISYKMK